MGNFIDHPNKITIREKWCKPLLQFLHTQLGYKLTYFGLPGIKALDIVSWIDYLDYIIAIDCGDYSENYDHEKAQENLKELQAILSGFERKEMISGYSLYLGYLEEVVLKGRDKNFKEFTQGRMVQVYNLDFCNSLTVPLEIADLDGNISKFYKNEVIRKLLEVQRDMCINGANSNFLMFITIHTRFWENEAEKYFNYSRYHKKYFEELKNLNPEDRKVRLLRFYFCDILKNHFTTNGFTPDFFPTILYDGVGGNRLVCFTVAGTYQKTPSATAPFNQQIGKLIKSKFISPDENDLIRNEGEEFELNVKTDPINHLVNFKSFKRLWQ
jgi:hypothetical protein